MIQNNIARVPNLIAQMTLDEKLAQMASFWAFELMDGAQLSPAKVQNLLSNGIGHVTRLAGASTLTPVEVARAANQIQHFLVNQTRLQIPAIIHEECCAGVLASGAPIYPQMLGVAASFEPNLARQMTGQIGPQLRAIGAHHGLAPVLDVAREPRWGRIEETFGEDPTLVAQFGVAYIQGLQGASLKNGGVMATGKHFIGHSLSQGGLNCAPTHMGQHDLWDIYIGPFQAAIRDAGVHTIMNSYPELDGEVVATSRRILTGMLRDQLGFNGVVVSDYEALLMIHTYHNAAQDLKTAAVLGLTAGIDIELPTRACFGAPLREALESGEINIEYVDAALQRLLAKKEELGLFDNPFVDEGRVLELFEAPANRSLAKDIAQKTMVLLKNDGILPLKKDIATLAVIGPNADSSRCLQNGYSYVSILEMHQHMPPAGSVYETIDQQQLNEYSDRVPTILSAFQSALPETKILYAPGCTTLGDDTSLFDSAVQAAAQADAVVLVLGDLSGMIPARSTGETRDVSDLKLPGVQEELAQAVLATGKPVIAVLVNGRPYAINLLAEKAQAVLEAWIPGQEGAAAIVETILGDANPGGKLPVTFPRNVGQLPIFYNQKPSGGKSNWYFDYVDVSTSPLYPFGHGLSYTTFDYAQFTLSKMEAQAGETIAISVQVTNTGEVSGDEVVQLYIRDVYARMPRPVKELKGFIRLKLEPGQSKQVTFELPVNQLAYYDSDFKLIVEPGAIKVMVGSSSEDIRCTGQFEISGKEPVLIIDRVFVCPVTVQ